MQRYSKVLTETYSQLPSLLRIYLYEFCIQTLRKCCMFYLSKKACLKYNWSSWFQYLCSYPFTLCISTMKKCYQWWLPSFSWRFTVLFHSPTPYPNIHSTYRRCYQDHTAVKYYFSFKIDFTLQKHIMLRYLLLSNNCKGK